MMDGCVRLSEGFFVSLMDEMRFGVSRCRIKYIDLSVLGFKTTSLFIPRNKSHP